jgi:catechol 2,3-dioxygenase-like lactoylglutathione lyase family enzyme
MAPVYRHTNLVARDWRRRVAFYVEVFGCMPVGAERDLGGSWLDESTGLHGAHLRGQHLLLPGHGPDGPTLEVFQYDETVEQSHPTADRLGFGHLAFLVEDVDATLEQLLAAGGTALGTVAETEIPDAGRLRVVYARDPEGNILELQRWTTT